MFFARTRRRRVLSDQVIAAAREMHWRGLVTGTVGNVSARFGDGMLITPTRREYAAIRHGDVVQLGLDGELRDGGCGSPSTEWPLHAWIYRARPDVAAIVHTHSPYATARSFDPSPIVVRTEERVYLGLTEIPVARAQPAGSEALAAQAVTTLAAWPAVLLARHGVLAVAGTPRAAVEMAAAVEHQAQIDWLVRLAGRQRSATHVARARTRGHGSRR
jgi:L-fuculose-phosphate aldolase